MNRSLGLILFLVLVAVARLSQAAGTVTASPKTQDIGSWVIGTSGVANLTLTNTASFFSIDIAKDAANCTNGQYLTVTSPSTFPQGIPHNGTLPVEVTFTPFARGARSCQFDVLDDADGVTVLETFTVSATGVAPVSSLSKSTLDFMKVRRATSKDLSFDISNTGDAGQTLAINSVAVMDGTGQYTLLTTPLLPTQVQPGSHVTITVDFKPITSGTANASVQIGTNDPINPSQMVNLTGFGTTAVIDLPASALIGDVVAGASGSTTVAVGNTGVDAKLTVSGASLTSSDAWITFANDPPGVTSCAGSKTCTFSPTLSIAAGSSTNVTVQCMPPLDAAGSQSETLTFTSDSDPAVNTATTVTCTVSDLIFLDGFDIVGP